MIYQQPYQPDLFPTRLPRFMLATDTLSEGCWMQKREDALLRAFLSPNTRRQVRALIFDIDRPQGAVAWLDANLPQPNIVTQNPKNGHAHLLYFLECPVSVSWKSRKEVIDYLARVQEGFTSALGADRHFTNRLTKNPLNPRHRAFFGRTEPYTLHDLREALPERLPRFPEKDKATGEGRNCTIFHTVRRWAYRYRVDYGNPADFERAILEQCERHNAFFPTPLDKQELTYIARSIAKWSWNRTTDTFSERQARVGRNGGKKSGVSRRSKSMDNLQRVMEFDR